MKLTFYRNYRYVSLVEYNIREYIQSIITNLMLDIEVDTLTYAQI